MKYKIDENLYDANKQLFDNWVKNKNIENRNKLVTGTIPYIRALLLRRANIYIWTDLNDNINEVVCLLMQKIKYFKSDNYCLFLNLIKLSVTQNIQILRNREFFNTSTILIKYRSQILKKHHDGKTVEEISKELSKKYKQPAFSTQNIQNVIAMPKRQYESDTNESTDDYALSYENAYVLENYKKPSNVDWEILAANLKSLLNRRFSCDQYNAFIQMLTTTDKVRVGKRKNNHYLAVRNWLWNNKLMVWRHIITGTSYKESDYYRLKQITKKWKERYESKNQGIK